MAQRIFDLLRGGVAGLGEGAEGGDVIEVAVVQGTDVHVEFTAGDHPQGGLLHPGGQPQADGQVVGGAEGDIPHGTAVPAVHHPADHFVQGAVAAAARHQVILAGVLGDLPGAVQPGTGGVDGDLVIVVGEYFDHLVEVGLGLLAAGQRVDDKQQFFHALASFWRKWTGGGLREPARGGTGRRPGGAAAAGRAQPAPNRPEDGLACGPDLRFAGVSRRRKGQTANAPGTAPRPVAGRGSSPRGRDR